MQEIILEYAKKGIYIDVLADCFKMKAFQYEPNERRVCWRPIINWFQDGEWHNDDCGCSSDLDVIMEDTRRNAEQIFQTIYDGVPLKITEQAA